MTPEGGWKSEEERQEARREVWSNALGWIEDGPELILGGKESRLVCHPISLRLSDSRQSGGYVSWANSGRIRQHRYLTFWD